MRSLTKRRGKANGIALIPAVVNESTTEAADDDDDDDGQLNESVSVCLLKVFHLLLGSDLGIFVFYCQSQVAL